MFRSRRPLRYEPGIADVYENTETDLGRNMFYFILTFLAVIAFGIAIAIVLNGLKNNIMLTSGSGGVSDPACSDGNPATFDVKVGDSGNACEHFTLPNGKACTAEASTGQCYTASSCAVSNGKATGASAGECPGTFYSIYPVDCPIPIFLSSLQSDINSALIYYFRDCYLGKCRIYVDYTVGDMENPIGHSSEQVFLPNFWNRLDYDPERERQCLLLISDLDPNKHCYTANVLWQYSTTTFTSRFMCEFSYSSASLRTLHMLGDTDVQTVLFGAKKTSSSSTSTTKKTTATSSTSPSSTTTNPKSIPGVGATSTTPTAATTTKAPSTATKVPSGKRDLEQGTMSASAPIIETPEFPNLSKFFYPMKQVIKTQIDNNVNNVELFWKSVPSTPYSFATTLSRTKALNIRGTAAGTTTKNSETPALESCLKFFIADAGVNVTYVNEFLAELLPVSGVFNITGGFADASAGYLEDVDHFYSYIYFNYLLGYCFF